MLDRQQQSAIARHIAWLEERYKQEKDYHESFHAGLWEGYRASLENARQCRDEAAGLTEEFPPEES